MSDTLKTLGKIVEGLKDRLSDALDALAPQPEPRPIPIPVRHDPRDRR